MAEMANSMPQWGIYAGIAFGVIVIVVGLGFVFKDKIREKLGK